MNSANSRIARLSSHVAASTGESTISPCPTASWHQTSFFNFEPGRHLLNQVCLVTGGGQGIGKAAALLFAHHGAKVVVSDIDESKAQATADFIRNSGGTAIVCAGDVTALDFPTKVIQAALDEFGALHILVNNAGYTWDGVIHRMSQRQWDAMLDVHCTAPFRLIQAAAPAMRDAAKKEIELHGRAHPRCIINVSSVSGTHGSAGQINYCTAKMGVVGMTKAVAREWGMYNIRCNALVLGYISTRLTQPKHKGGAMESRDGEKIPLGVPEGYEEAAKMQIALGRIGAPEEAAGSMLLLASPYASYLTGQAIEVTGGGWM